MGKYTGFYVYHRSYYLWSPVIPLVCRGAGPYIVLVSYAPANNTDTIPATGTN